MTNVVGNWKLEKNEKWDKYLETVGVNIMLRKIANALTTYEEIKREGDVVEVNMRSTFKNQFLKSKLGEEFEEETGDGQKVMTTFLEENGNLVQMQRTKSCGTVKIVRYLEDEDTMIITYTVQDLTAKRTFKRYTP